MDARALDRRTALDPENPAVSLSPGRIVDSFDDRAGAPRQLDERGLAPPGQVMGRRVDQEVRDPGQRRRDVRNADKDEAAGLRRCNDFGEQRLRIADVLEDLETADRIVRRSASNEMLGQRLVADALDRRVFGEIGIEAGIVGLRHALPEIAMPAADVEHARVRRNMPGRDQELLANGLLSEEAPPLQTRIKLSVEFLVALQR